MSTTKEDTERLARDLRTKGITREIKQLPLTKVMEEMFGLAGEKSGARHIKYRPNGSVIFNVEKDGSVWGALGQKFKCLEGKGGSAGAIDLVMAVKESVGETCDFMQAREALQRQFLPNSIGQGYVPSANSHSLARGDYKRRDPGVETPISLPPRVNKSSSRGKTKNLEHACRSYLLGRSLPAELVDAMFKSNSAYPTENIVYKKDDQGKDTKEILYQNTAICFPIAGMKTRKPIAYQLKIVYDDPKAAKARGLKDSFNHGPVTQGFAMIGPWNEKTKHLALTEAVIDAGSFWALTHGEIRKRGDRKAMKSFMDETCVMATTGSRMPEELLLLCKERGISVTTAFDNDHPGRTMSKKVAEFCKEHGIKHTDRLVDSAEIHLLMEDDEKGKKRAQETMELCMKNKTTVIQQPTRDGWIRMVIDNTEQTAEHVAKLKDEDRLDRQSVHLDEKSKKNKKVEVIFYNKDWNDLVQGGYQRSFTSEYELNFKAGKITPELACKELTAQEQKTEQEKQVQEKPVVKVPEVTVG